ncbi:MAG: efflux RND transporter periplasmic adaptor subunit, partial [Chloroflexota bacterium]
VSAHGGIVARWHHVRGAGRMATPMSNPTPGAGGEPDGPRVPTPDTSPAQSAAAEAGHAAEAETQTVVVRQNGAVNGSTHGETNGHGAVTPADAVTVQTVATDAAPALRLGPEPAASAGQPAPGAPAVAPSAPVVAPAAALPSVAPAAAAQRGPAPAGRPAPNLESAEAYRAKARGRRKRFFLLIPILLIAAVAVTIFGYRYWYQATYFVSTDNASVTGDLVQVGSLNAGRIVATRVDVGRTVQAGQEIAVVAMPQEVSSGTLGSGPRMGITGTTDTLVPVYSPLTGIVAARMGHVGGTVVAGQPIFSLVDPHRVWIKANIEEASAWRLEPGQEAEIHVDALNRDFIGRVDAITPASAATFSLLPSNNASGNFTKVTQYVPVKIVVDTRDVVLPLGTSVEVRIKVREPSSEFPLPWQP